jgi:hypothetical protein
VLFAWSPPGQAPTGGNVSAPLNVSGTVGTKAGGLWLNTGGASNGLIVQSGNVGIDTTSPSQALDVNGYLRIRTINGEGGTIVLDGANSTTIYVENINGKFRLVNSPWTAELFGVDQSGNAYANGYFHYSDAGLKDAIATSSGLSIVNRLRGVTFEWKKDGTPSAGVIAQEVERVMPSAVKTNLETGLKSVEYDQLIAPLIEAIKEQQAQIDSLTHEVETLKADR